MLINWGKSSSNDNSGTVNFPLAFSGKSKFALSAAIINESKYSYYPMLNDVTSSAFKYQINYGGISTITGYCNYIAVGK